MQRGAVARTLAPATLALALAACADDAAPTSVDTHVDDWRDHVIYQVVVDRFADGAQPLVDDPAAPVPGELSRWQGGDWRGLRARLDYLEDLGVTALWISPIVRQVPRGDTQDGYHGYWAADFTSLEPRFGDEAELRALIDDAHARGMLVIVDVVINHAGRVFDYDLDDDGAVAPDEVEPPFAATTPYEAPLVWRGERPRLWREVPGASDDGADVTVEARALADDEFHRRGATEDFSLEVQRELGDFPTGLRDLDTEAPGVIDDLATTWATWIARLDLDGLRLDAAPHVPRASWRVFAERLRARAAALGKDRLLLLGEVWNGDPAVLASYTDEGALDAAFDFSLKWDVIDGFLLDGRAAADVAAVLTTHREAYPATGHPGGAGLDPWRLRVAFADNHDTGRLRGQLDDAYVAELAMTLVFTVDAIPCVYYGTEQELTGRTGHAAREPLWDTGYARGTRMYRHLARLAAIRAAHPALRRGALTLRYASETSARERGPGVGLLAFERGGAAGADDAAEVGADRVLVALNGHPADDAIATVPTGFAPGTALVDLLDPAAHAVTVAADGTVAVTVPPRAARLYAAR